jgi:thymidylate kinase
VTHFLITEHDLAPLPDLAREQRMLRGLVESACAEPTKAGLLFVADVIAGRRLAYENLLAERIVWTDRFVDSSADAREHPEYLRRLHAENAARSLVVTAEDALAVLMEFLV